MGVSRPQKRRDQVPALPVEVEKRMVDVLAVVAVVVTALPLAVGGVCGRVEVQEYLL